MKYRKFVIKVVHDIELDNYFEATYKNTTLISWPFHEKSQKDTSLRDIKKKIDEYWAKGVYEYKNDAINRFLKTEEFDKVAEDIERKLKP